MVVPATDNGTVSEAFSITNSVRQDYISTLTLFNIVFSAILINAYRDERPGTRIVYNTDRHFRNCRRIQASTRLFVTTVRDLLFADDHALTPET
nr:unnamed protein product [Spirometra erinaceieuropaei]